MLQAFLSVVYELWCFVRGVDVTVAHEPPQTVPLQLPVMTATSSGSTETSDTTVPIVPVIPIVAPESVDLAAASGVMYVAVSTTTLSRVPRDDFDATIMTLPYGAAVSVVSYEGRYAKVLRAESEGWVQKDHLHPTKEAVWPFFIAGEVYDADHAETKKLRCCIADAFTTRNIGLPLQAVEYVTFRLAEDHRFITWPNVRPRSPGSWQWLLRGRVGIHARISPATDSIVEWLGDDGFGRLGYVEAVRPDQSILVSLVGYRTAGLYEQVEWSVSEWRELRPVFIEVL